MAKKIKFALEMANGIMVRRNIEELREHFDLEKAVGYFLEGKLVTWLADRYYEDAVAKLEEIEKDAPDLPKRLCVALGVPMEKEVDLDVEQVERLNEKTALLREKTSDESILSHAAQTAFTQEDLADLLDMEEPVIYLCGESFNVPIRMENKKYIGILGTPKVNINANSREELDEKSIVFENVLLPWRETIPTVSAFDSKEIEPDEQIADDGFMDMDILKEIADKTIFGYSSYGNNNPVWGITPPGSTIYDRSYDLTKGSKKIYLQRICQGKYREDQLIRLEAKNDYSEGWAVTIDSLCYAGRSGKFIIKYSDIHKVENPISPDSGLERGDQVRIMYSSKEGVRSVVLESYPSVPKAYLSTVRDLISSISNE